MWPFRRKITKRTKAKLVALADARDVTQDADYYNRLGALSQDASLLVQHLLLCGEGDAASRLIQRIIRPRLLRLTAETKAKTKAKTNE